MERGAALDALPPGPRSASFSATVGSERAPNLAYCAGSAALFSNLDFSRKSKVAVQTSRRVRTPRSPEKNHIAAERVMPTVTGRCGVICRPLLWLKGFPKAKVSLNESSGLTT